MSKEVVKGLRKHLDQAYDEIKSLRIRIGELEHELSSLRGSKIGEETVKGSVVITSTKGIV